MRRIAALSREMRSSEGRASGLGRISIVQISHSRRINSLDFRIAQNITKETRRSPANSQSTHKGEPKPARPNCGPAEPGLLAQRAIRMELSPNHYPAVSAAGGCGLGQGVRGRREPFRAFNARARPSDDGHGEPGHDRADRVGRDRSTERRGA